VVTIEQDDLVSRVRADAPLRVGPEASQDRLGARGVALLLAMTTAAIGVHGYHPYVEDAEIYLPGIKKILDPALYPRNTGFFASHAGMTLFPNLIAASVRITHIPFDWALLAWQFGCVFVLLLACWKIGRLVFRDPLARWGGVALVGSLLTIPVAGTALYIMDQYLNTRSLSAATVLMMVASVGEQRYARAGLWALFTVAIHPLMFVFGFTFALVVLGLRVLPMEVLEPEMALAALIPVGLFPPMSNVYHEALQSRPYFFLSRWAWYEWVGLIAPFAAFWLIGRWAKKQEMFEMEQMCKALNIFGLIFAVASLLTIPAGFERFTLLQPMRYLHLTYVLMFVFAGGLLAQKVLRRRVLRWIVLFVPLCAGMFFVQRDLFAATPQLELPGVASPNAWVLAFVWIRQNAPKDAYFALNPEHSRIVGEDQHGFRAIAERSMLADNNKDSGAVTMFPGMAETWKEQTTAQEGWGHFQRADFKRLKSRFGVDWVVVEQSSVADLDCPYSNEQVKVCRIE